MKLKYKIWAAIAASLLPPLVMLDLPDFGLIDSNINLFLLQLSAYFAYISIVLLMWQMVLGTRKLIGIFIPNKNYEIGTIQKTLGLITFPLTILHPALLARAYATSNTFIIDFSAATTETLHISLGRASYLVLFAAWVGSLLLHKRLSYRAWKYINLAPYVVMPLLLKHALELGSNINSSVQLRYYWLALSALFLIIVTFKIASYLGFKNTPYIVQNRQKLSPNICQLTLAPKKVKLTPEYGQYFYVKPSRMSDAQPFSVSKLDHETGRVQLTFKITGGFTAEMSRLSPGKNVQLEGPYGSFTSELNHDDSQKVVFVSAGIGITPFVQHILTRDPARTIAISCTPDLESAVFRQDMKDRLKRNYFDFIDSQVKDDAQTINRRLSGQDVGRIMKAKRFAATKTLVYICGSPEFMKTIRAQLVESGVKPDNVITESFNF